MKLREAIEKLGSTQAMSVARDIAPTLNIDWHDGVSFVLDVIAKNPDRAPGNVGGALDNEEALVEKWLKKYRNGFRGRASLRHSNPPGTVADPMIETIIEARLTQLKQPDLHQITSAHRLAMSAENILGLILEEYLAINLKTHRWLCAWGETVKSVDFVNENGELLQIKNRSNSENSSSSTVRDGTTIQRGHRIKADRVEYMWDQLNTLCNTTHLSESEFVGFAKKLIVKNPGCLAVESNNTWLS